MYNFSHKSCMHLKPAPAALSAKVQRLSYSVEGNAYGQSEAALTSMRSLSGLSVPGREMTVSMAGMLFYSIRPNT